MVGGRPLEIKSFTQEEVNAGKVFYQHTEYMETWQQKDRINLEITTAYAPPLVGQSIDVDVSFANINSENQVRERKFSYGIINLFYFGPNFLLTVLVEPLAKFNVRLLGHIFLPFGLLRAGISIALIIITMH
jgi:hypothetical protein